MEDKRLFLLDAYALIYRAYYALIRSPRITSKGFNTSAIFGFCNTLDEILRKENPTHIAVCFDPRGETFRHEAYPEYKAQRDKQPEDITESLPWIHKILDAYNIPSIEVAGYEADDVIGTLSRMAESEGFMTYMMTPDKDYGQLVTDRVMMYRPSLRGEGFEIRGPKQVCERYGIERPHQVIDLLALEGDVSDNVPGCPGVGEKTAAKLIAQWGSVENLIAHTDDLKGAIQKKIRENSEQIMFSKFLVTIKTDVPLEDITPASLERKAEDVERLKEIYRELEFRMFIKRLDSGKEPAEEMAEKSAKSEADGFVGSLFDVPVAEEPAPLADISSSAHSYRMITSVAEAAEVVAEALKSDRVAIAVNGFGEQAMTARVDGMAISSSPSKADYIVLPSDPARRAGMAAVIEPLLSGKTMIVSHDVKRSMLLLRRENIRLTARYYDTSIAHYLLDPERKHTLAFVAARYLGYNLLDAEPEGGRVSHKPKEFTPQEATERFCETADLTLRLYDTLHAEIDAQGLARLMDEIELPLVSVLAAMEWTGVRIDSVELARLSRDFTARLGEMEREIYALAGMEFNISSPMQVGEVLFDHLKLDASAKRTKKGGYSTTEEILEKLRPKHPIVDLILRYRALRKLLTTYVNALPSLVNPSTGKIHTSYNQTVTATGRISSTNPNLQNIPIRSDDGREIRRAFIADEGNLIMSADYSQIELRLIADMSGDEDMVEAFRSGEDIHRATAAKIYHLKPEEVTDTLRRNAKTANFGIIYGISAFGLSERLGIPRAEAKMLIDGYFASYPHIREYMDRNIETAREKGYVQTIMGRKRMLPDINSRSAVVRGYAERNAINAPIQGSAADIIKKAMVTIFRAMESEGMESRMIMQVHDELVFDVKPAELPKLQKLVTEHMEGAYSGKVNMEVASGVGVNWLEAH